MKRLVCVAVILIFAVPAWPAAKKITVAELQDMLQSMHRDKKDDAEVATALKQVLLTEQLTRPVMNSLVDFVPEQLSTEQIYVLEARSATLAPPAGDIPSTPAPDAAAQQALLAKAARYASTTNQQLPSLTATRTTLRFQDNMEALAESSGMHGSAKDASQTALGVVPNQFVRYINATDSNIALEHGVERLPEDKTRWGSNRMIAIMTPYPGLPQIFQEATDSGTIKWLRWELVNGKPAAVFSYQVTKKKAHVVVNICCFPEIDQAGTASFTSAATAGAHGNGSGGATGNFQTNTDWHPYKQNNLPYHGELFIDPDTGIVVRMIAQMEPKSSDVVHQDEMRIDFAPVTVGDKALVLPVRAVAITQVVVNGEAGAGGYSERCTLFTSEYKNYELAGK
jgi:hypothetical protein